ncbi:MAG: bifunctional oligoribonuclease/PAP phosphatase NrnA [Treponemataceae bacterium]|nr:bifunctional oligoribonuclease/PAP phosphatase NrnA [Treponemataceae bacterium]
MHIITQAETEKFKGFLNAHEAFIIVGHKEPDGDCIASTLGAAELVRRLGKKAVTVNAGPFKRTELKKYEKYFNQKVKNSIFKKNVALIIVDCSEMQRLGDIDERLSSLDSFIIDHHKTSAADIQNSIIDSTSPAAACIVQQLFENIIGKPDTETAETLFFGLATDTGFFRFLDTTGKEAFQAASRLIEYGANPRTTYDDITGGKPWSTRKLLGQLLSKAETHFDGRLAITIENIDDTRRFGQEGRDSDALYQLMLSCASVQAVVFLREESEQTCTLGFRSKDDIDVSKVASIFGGGGHKNAAGACTEGTPETIMPKILSEFEKIFM